MLERSHHARLRRSSCGPVACWIFARTYSLALVARELARLDIDIAAFSEVRFAEQGSLLEDGAGYTLFWSGKNKDERRLSGVGFMIKTSIARKLQNLPVGHSDRIMSLNSQSRTTSLQLSPVCTHLLCRLKLE